MCDTYVSLSTWSKNGNVIFGKNSDRLDSEIQLITYAPRKTYSSGEEVKFTINGAGHSDLGQQRP